MDEIDSISLEELLEINQKKFIFYSKKLKKQKVIYESINFFSLFLIFLSTIITLLFHDDIILGILNGLALLIQSFLRLKNYQKKIVFYNLISDQYYCIINAIMLYKHEGKEFNQSNLINRIKIIDDLSSICLSSDDLFLAY